MAKTNSNPTRRGCNIHAQLLFTLRGESRLSCKAAVILNSNWAVVKHHWLKALAPHSPLDPHISFFAVQGKRAKNLGLRRSCQGNNLLCGREGAAVLRRARAAVPREAPDPAAASSLGRRRPSDPGAHCRVPGPEAPSQLGSSPGFPRVPRLPAGRAGTLKLRAASRGREGGPNRGGILLPLSLRRPPVASRSARLLSAPDAEPARPWPVPQVVRGSKPHAKHLQGGRPEPRLPASSARGRERILRTSTRSTPAAAAGAAAVTAPPWLRPLARPALGPLPPPPPPRPREGAGGKRLAEPGA